MSTALQEFPTIIEHDATPADDIHSLFDQQTDQIYYNRLLGTAKPEDAESAHATLREIGHQDGIGRFAMFARHHNLDVRLHKSLTSKDYHDGIDHFAGISRDKASESEATEAETARANAHTCLEKYGSTQNWSTRKQAAERSKLDHSIDGTERPNILRRSHAKIMMLGTTAVFGMREKSTVVREKSAAFDQNYVKMLEEKPRTRKAIIFGGIGAVGLAAIGFSSYAFAARHGHHLDLSIYHTEPGSTPADVAAHHVAPTGQSPIQHALATNPTGQHFHTEQPPLAGHHLASVDTSSHHQPQAGPSHRDIAHPVLRHPEPAGPGHQTHGGHNLGVGRHVNLDDGRGRDALGKPHKGYADTIWYHAEHRLGKHASDQKISSYVSKILRYNHMSWYQAAHLPVGTTVNMPAPN